MGSRAHAGDARPGKAGVAYKLFEYDYDPNAARIGMQAAEALGVEGAAAQNLMAKAGDSRLRAGAVRPRGEFEKARAGRRRQERSHVGRGDAERITGYHVGGISPFGQKKRVRVFIEQAALAFPHIVVNGGRRGLQVELTPADLMRVLGAVAAKFVERHCPRHCHHRDKPRP